MCPILKSLGKELLKDLDRIQELGPRNFVSRADMFAQMANLHFAIGYHRDSCPECKQVDFSVHQSLTQTFWV
jgi:hypothetical protein